MWYWRSKSVVLARPACAVLGVAALLCTQAQADDASIRQTHFEFSSGAHAYRDVWSAYSGFAIAPFGAIDQDGVRLRFSGGYGGDRYAGPAGGKFQAATTFADAFVGYHHQWGALTLKGFAGLTVTDRQIRPADPAASVQGTRFGGKVAVETWLNLGDRAWTALDLSWASHYQDYAGRARLGWRFMPQLSAGLEAGAVGNFDCDILRAAAFLRYELASGEVSLSGGVSSDAMLDGKGNLDAGSATPFAMLSWLHRF